MIHLRLFGGAAEPGRPAPLECSFEQAEQRLGELPRMFFEPDGSFVWRGDQPAFQWDGEVYDAGGHVQHVEIRGQGSAASLRQLLEAFGDLSRLRVLSVGQDSVAGAATFLAAYAEHG